jgi:mannose-1-phosphate guanylyltransferase
MERPIVACVLAGGTGTRLYPATRSDRPKQFRALGGDRSLLAETVARTGFADETYVLTRPAFAEAVREHAPSAAVLTEPTPRDTGPALVYAAHRIREQRGDCALVCLPSDHRVGEGFDAVAGRAARAAADTGGLVTVGMEPTRPETGYGYIQPAEGNGDSAAAQSDGDARPVARFHEKPDAESAERYVERGWYWNAGVFAWQPTALLEAARESALAPLVDALEGNGTEAAIESTFEGIDAVSVDEAILERAENVVVVPADLAWDDLGTWDALARVEPADDEGNVVLGEAVTVDAADNVVATDGHVSLVDVEGLVVASYDDRTLVLPRGEGHRVREVVARLQAEDRF